MSDLDHCWICDSTNITYTDVIGCHWCGKCYSDIYLADT